MADSKQTLDKRKGSTPFTGFPVATRALGSRTSFVSVKTFHYRKQNFGVPSNVTDHKFTNDEIMGVDVGLLEEEIASMKMSKNISQASGTFELQLHPTQNWKSKLSPGDWVAIFMYDHYKVRDIKNDDNTKNLIMLANIDRVSRSLQKDENSDKVMLRYTVSGRGFGKVLEETDLWYDPYVNQENVLDVMLRTEGLSIDANPSDMVSQVLKIFLGRGGVVGDQQTTGLNQWRIPNELARLFKANTQGTPLFYDILKQVITPNMPGIKVRNTLTPESSGSVWTMLERSSNSLVNEIFLEEVRDSQGRAFPNFVCRPRPLNTPFFDSQFGANNYKEYLNGCYKTLQKLSRESFVEISPAEIIYEDMGKDDHSRLNMYWLRVQQNYDSAYSNASSLNSKGGIANPTFNRPSIQRHGLKRFDQTLEFSRPKADDGSAIGGVTPDLNLFKAFMAQSYDQNYANHLYDSGTITCTGVLEAELGKALLIAKDQAIKGSKPKIYYIEGYSHEWTFPSTWRTTFTLTHGQFQDTSANIYIDAVGPGDFGAADALIQTTYLSKTKTGKK